jgi:hypothetical protein
MTTLSFDTLKFANRLKDAGVTTRQAEAEAHALFEALDLNIRELASRDDLKSLETHIDARLKIFDSRLQIFQWMLGFLLAGVSSIVLKTWF